jgi:hypothetical protein
LKDSVVGGFKEVLTLIGQGDPSTPTNAERFASLHDQIDADVAAFHELIRTHRTHQGVETIIQLLELEISDYQRAIDELGRAQAALHEAIRLDDDTDTAEK